MDLENLERNIKRIKKRDVIKSNTLILIGGHNGTTFNTEGMYYDEDKNSIIIY